MSTKMSLTITFIALLFLAAYTAAWFWTANVIKQELAVMLQNAKDGGVTINGLFPTIGGFPGRHEIAFFGSLSHEDTILEISGIRIKGFFLPGEKVIIECPDGFALRGSVDPDIWSVSYLRLDAIVPTVFPQDLTVEGMRAWKAAGGHIEFTNIELSKRKLDLKGTGNLVLDDNLQPSGHINAKIYGNYVDFLMYLQQKDMVETKEALLAGAILSGLTRNDESRQYIEASLTLENNVFYLGPLRLTEVAQTEWPWRNLPKPDMTR